MENITNEQLDSLIKSAVNSSGPLPPDEKFSQLISALRELRTHRNLINQREKISKSTNHPAHGPVSLDRLHQIREILSKAAAQSDGGNLGYAMADAVKVIDVAIAAFGAEPVAWRYRYVHTPKTEEHGYPFTTEWKLCDSEDECNPPDCFERQPLYTAQPVPELMKDHQIRELVNDLRDIAIEYHGTQQLRERIARTVRAAMIQAGNSPVTPDGYVLVPKEMTPEMMRAVQIKSELGGYAASELSGAYDMFREFWGVAVTSAPLYTAPSELVTPDGSTCKYCGGTGYFRWQKSAETFPCPCVGCDLPSAGGK